MAKEWIDKHFNRIRVIEAARCDVPLETLLAAGCFEPADVVAQHDRRLTLQAVGRRTEIYEPDDWGERTPRCLTTGGVGIGVTCRERFLGARFLGQSHEPNCGTADVTQSTGNPASGTRNRRDWKERRQPC